jgi:uncharacterized protein (UPF0264 family)
VIAPQLLVSVRNAREADDALRGGADWIDLKEPSRGPLGAVDAATAREVVECVAGRAPISAAAGELVDWRGGGDLTYVAGVAHLKLGLAACAKTAWEAQWLAAHTMIARAGKSLVAVIYADADVAHSPPTDSILTLAAESRCAWALWDTYDKQGRSLRQLLENEDLTRQLRAAHAAGQRTVLAGRLTLDQIVDLPLECADMIAVRGAACRAGRTSSVCAERVAQLRDLLSRHASCSSRPASAGCQR